MTVQELIEQLQEFDGTAEVLLTVSTWPYVECRKVRACKMDGQGQVFGSWSVGKAREVALLEAR